MSTNTLYVIATYSMFTAYRKILCKTRSRPPHPPLSFPCPSRLDGFQTSVKTGCLEIQLGICVDRFTVLFRKRNLRLLAMLWTFISQGLLSLTSQNFKIVSQPLRCRTSHCREG